jgi:hypothetical protein
LFLGLLELFGQLIGRSLVEETGVFGVLHSARGVFVYARLFLVAEFLPRILMGIVVLFDFEDGP